MMKKFLSKALQNLHKLPEEQVHRLIDELAGDNDLLEMVLTSIPGGVIVTDTENRVSFVNSQARRVFPLVVGELLEKPVTDVIRDKTVAGEVEKALAEQSTVHSRDFILERGGRTMFLRFSLLPLVKKGRIRGNLLYGEDVTERRGEEARLRRAESLASLATMTAGVAHEIKNPLGSMGIYIQLLQKMLDDEKCGDEARDDMREYLEVISEEIDRLNTIVVNYLFAVRPMNLETEPADINELLKDLVDFIQYELEENRITPVLDLCAEVPRLEIDEKLIKQALLNVIKNAQAAMPLGGEIRIRTAVRDSQVLISLADTGEGIPEDNLEKIFEPYFTTKESGSGLGLTLVYKIIKEHGGDIQVLSPLNEGTEFRVFLPIPQKEQRLIESNGAVYDI
jgi:PAS domain S-box-containing protein